MLTRQSPPPVSVCAARDAALRVILDLAIDHGLPLPETINMVEYGTPDDRALMLHLSDDSAAEVAWWADALGLAMVEPQRVQEPDAAWTVVRARGEIDYWDYVTVSSACDRRPLAVRAEVAR